MHPQLRQLGAGLSGDPTLSPAPFSLRAFRRQVLLAWSHPQEPWGRRQWRREFKVWEFRVRGPLPPFPALGAHRARPLRCLSVLIHRPGRAPRHPTPCRRAPPGRAAWPSLRLRARSCLGTVGSSGLERLLSQALRARAAWHLLPPGLAPGAAGHSLGLRPASGRRPCGPSPRPATPHAPSSRSLGVGEDQAVQHGAAWVGWEGLVGGARGPQLGPEVCSQPISGSRKAAAQGQGVSWGSATPASHAVMQRR